MARRRRDGRQPHPRDLGRAPRARRRSEQSTLRADRPSPRLPIRRARPRARRLRRSREQPATRCAVRRECRAWPPVRRPCDASVSRARRAAVLACVGDRAGRGCALAITAEPEPAAVEPRAPRRRRSGPCGCFSRRPTGATIVSGGVLSPDGESLTFVARDDASGETALWVRALHSSAPQAAREHGRRCPSRFGLPTPAGSVFSPTASS